MQAYKNISGGSGVCAYDTGIGFIRIEFQQGARYLYTTDSTGAMQIETMLQLAGTGRGLNTYINRVVRNKFACKEC